MDNNKTAELPPVLKISERRRRKQSSAERHYIPQFMPHKFSPTLYRILLRTGPPTAPINLENKYLGVLCLKNVKANIRMYHMFFTRERDVGKDYASIRSLYAKDPDIKPFNNVTIRSICPVTLHRSAVNHFTEYTWNKDGNVLITPISETDEWIMSQKLHSLNTDQDLRVLNYVKFLELNKM